jgi:hypothetical protein
VRNLLVIAICLMSPLSRAVTVNVNCDYSEITNAIEHVNADNTTIHIGPGDDDIPETIIINVPYNNFVIEGSGTNQTILRSGSSLNDVFYFLLYPNTLTTAHDLNLVADYNNTGFIFTQNPSYASGVFGGRYHFYNITMTNVMFRGISVGDGDTFGLVDHVYLENKTDWGPQFFDLSGNDYHSWTNPVSPIGTSNACYFEDFYLKNTSAGGNGFFDCYKGAQMVFRHGVFDGYSAAGDHGYDSQPTSARLMELYDCIWTNSDHSPGLVDIRGGVYIGYSNSCYYVSNSPGGMTTLQYYRACLTNFPTGDTPTAINDHSNDPDTAGHTGWLSYGQAGSPYIVNFANHQEGYAPFCNGNPSHGDRLFLGLTRYTFVSSLAAADFTMVDSQGFGGGAVLIGATVAATISNLFHAVNADTNFYGISHTNWSEYGVPYRVGHDFLPVSMTATNITFRNALDGSSSGVGYPANQQEGVLVSYPLDGTNFVNNQVIFGCYEWGNTLNGVQTTFNIVTACDGGQWGGLQSGRDYFDNVVPDSGTYTAFVYPHPLNSGRGGGGSGGSTSASTKAFGSGVTTGSGVSF